jgi:hypothetical protein
MDWRKSRCHGFSSVVIHDLDIVGVVAPPTEADAPLVVDPDAVLALLIAAQSLKPVTGRYPQIVKALRSVQHPELPQGHPLHLNSKASSPVSREQPLRVPVAEAPDHGAS